MREATGKRLGTFYSDFLSLLDRGINPFTMDGGEYFYLKSMQLPMRDGTTHPDLFANIQLNIMANKTGRAHFQPPEISRMELFCIDEPIFNYSDNYPGIHSCERPSKIDALVTTNEYLEFISNQARSDDNCLLDTRAYRKYKEIAAEYSNILGRSLIVRERSDFLAMKHAYSWLARHHTMDFSHLAGAPTKEEIEERSIKYNIFNAILISDMTVKSLTIDFLKLKKDDDEAEQLRKLTVIILAYSLLNDSCYFQDKPMPVMAVMSCYTRYFPEAFCKAEDLRKIFTDDFDFPIWYGIVHGAQLFSHLMDDGGKPGPQREEIIKEIEKIHSQGIRDKAFHLSPPKGQDDVPMITILNSFIPELKDGAVMPLSEADKRFGSIHRNLNRENVDHRHDARISFTISFDRDGIRETVTVPESLPMDLCRESKIPHHVALLVSKGLVRDQGLPAFLSKHIGLSTLEERLKTDVIPSIETAAERNDYRKYVQAFIKSNRRLLNQHHDIDIAAPLDVKTYRTARSLRTTRRERRDAGKSDDEAKSPQRLTHRTRTKQEKRKRRLR